MSGPDQPFDPDSLRERLDVNFALKAAGLGIWEVDPTTNLVIWDDRCRELFGLAKDNLLPYEQAIQYIHPEDVEGVNEAVVWAMNPESGGDYDLTYRTIGADDGLLRWVRFSGQGYFNDTGQVIRFAGVAQDVTSQVTVQQSQLQTLASFEQAPIAIAILTSPNLTYRMANAHYRELVGRTADELLGKPLLEAVPETRGQGFVEVLEQVISTGTIYTALGTPSTIRQAGSQVTRYFDFTYQPWQGQDQTQGVMIVANDVTDQVLARQTVESSEIKLRALIEESPVATCLFIGRQMTIDLANKTMLSYWGKGTTALGLPLAQAVPELNGQPFLAILDEVFTTGQPYEANSARAELEVDGVMGTYYFDFTYTPLRNASGEVYGVMDSAVDVTQAVIARQELQESEWFAHSLFDNSPIAKAVFIGEQMLIRTVNENMLDLWGRDASIVGKPFLEVLPELRPTPQLQRMQHTFKTGETFHQAEERFELVRYGQPYVGYYEYTYKALRWTTGEIYGIICAASEVTQQVLTRRKVEESEARYRLLSEQLEQQVQERTEELAAVNEELTANNEGLEAHNEEYAAINEELEEANSLLVRSNDNLQQFAYVASHDLQEPLRKIQQFGDLLKARQTSLSGDDLVYIDRIQSAASRMSTLIRDLLNFSRISTQRDTSQPVALNQVVDQVLTTLELTIAETNAEVRVDPLPTIQGDASQLAQLFQNLVGNALKFRRPSVVPFIQIQVKTLEMSELPASIKPMRVANLYYQIDVVDNGVGFDEKYLDRIFLVFQRLHGKGEFAGTGIGLAICERVVANHSGAITARSQPGQGTTFTVYLPV